MKKLYLFAYAAIEIAVFVLMVKFLGVGWAVLITIAAAVAGIVLLRQQGRKVFAELRRASRNEVDARSPLTDTALLAASSLLMVIPGVVSTLVGIILLAPPVRTALRPAVTALGARRMAASMDRAGLYATGFVGGRVVDGTVSDGTVVDTTVVDTTVVDVPGTGTGGRVGDAGLPQLPRGR